MSFLTRQNSLNELAAERTQDFSRAANSSRIKPPEILNERFRILEEVGRGGMAVVYLAEDLTDGKQVALKLMNSQLKGTAKRRFTREFSTIASLKHPHLIEVYEYGESAEGPFFAMEYFHGETAAALKNQPLSVVLPAIHDLCEAIDFVHKKRIIHRDIKPANILVRHVKEQANWEVRLSDFGLAKFANTSSSLSGDVNFLGTLAYCSPEQIMREELDQRSDLYSLGVVVYELLAGQHPFEGQRKDIQSLVTAQITTVPQGVAQIRDDISRELDRAIMRLLAKDAESRPPSTSQLRAAIAQTLGWQTSNRDAESVAEQENLTGRFVGRSDELAKAEKLIANSLAPRNDRQDSGSNERILFVAGEAGIGKTSIVRRAARNALVVGGRVYDGRCFEGNIAPFQPFAEILRQILSELDEVKRRVKSNAKNDELASTTFLHAGDASTQINDIVEQYAIDLLKVGPELRTLLANQPASSPHEIQRDSKYVFRSIANFFLEIAKHQPICLIIEDVHWADRSTIDLLRQIANALASEPNQTDHASTRLAIYCTTRNGAEFESGLEWIHRLCEQQVAYEIELKSIARKKSFSRRNGGAASAI